MNNLMKFERILDEIIPENGFLQVAKLFAAINKMSLDELIVVWQTVKHFEVINGNTPQLTNLKKSIIVAMADLMRQEKTMLKTMLEFSYNKLVQRVDSVLQGEDKVLFEKGKSPLSLI